MTVIATAGERFSDFAPYVASVDDAGLAAFQAALRGREAPASSPAPAVRSPRRPALAGEVAGVTSHPTCAAGP
jgi:hypothetical protein